MQHVASHLPTKSSISSKPESRAAEPVVPRPQSQNSMDQLWRHMSQIYGHKWTSAYTADPAGSAATTWSKGLSGLSGRQLADGLAACIASADQWPPTLPQFRMMCLGIPPFDAVRADASQQDGFTRLVWQYLDGHRYRLASADKADKLLQAAYSRAKEFVMRGGQLPAAPVAEIEHQLRQSVPATRDQVARHMDDIARELGVADAEEDPVTAAEPEVRHAA